MLYRAAALALSLTLGGCVGTVNVTNPEVNTQINAQANTDVAVTQSGGDAPGPTPTPAASSSPMPYSYGDFTMVAPGLWTHQPTQFKTEVLRFAADLAGEAAVAQVFITLANLNGFDADLAAAKATAKGDLLGVELLQVDGSKGFLLTQLVSQNGFPFKAAILATDYFGQEYRVALTYPNDTTHEAEFLGQLRGIASSWKWAPVQVHTGFASAAPSAKP